MECTLAALIACFSWSNFYVDGGLSFQDVGTPRQEWRTHVYNGPAVIETRTQLETIDDPYNPYGRFALGYQLDFKSVTISLEASHVSSLDTDADRGINAISLKARWYPFRR